MKRPNILIVTCDQLSAQALSPWGNCDADTPNIDALVASGLRCESAYTNCPLCQPSRASFWTSRYPHQLGVSSNGRKCPVSPVRDDLPTLGSLFYSAGYRTIHFGKQHDAGALRGFTRAPVEEAETVPQSPSLQHNYDSRQDRRTREQVVEFLKEYKDEQPYLAVADFNNPHNICGWIGDNAGNVPLKEIFEELPKIPANLYMDNDELRRRPLPIQYLASAHRRQAQIAEWDELKIRHYLHAYHHYLSLADAEIGNVLCALRSRHDADDTLVVFFSDHGDAMAGRWMATKHTSFYEETMHVPLVFSGPGIKSQGRTMSGLCCLLDILPTLCDFAGIEIPESAQGRSLYPNITRDSAITNIHEAIFAQWHTEWGYTVEPGRMVRTERYKYTHYLEGNGEELYDLKNDPGELKNLANEPSETKALKQHRDLLDTYIRQTNDPYRTLQCVIDPMFRANPPCYRHYQGPVAPDILESITINTQ